MPKRKKLSTTISPESYALLQRLVKSGKAESLAQALDRLLEEFRRAENRERLELETAAYIEGRSPAEIEEDAALEAALGEVVKEVHFDD